MTDRIVIPDGGLALWTIYDNPKDYPGCFVARMWLSLPGGEVRATPNIMVSPSIDTVRRGLQALGLTVLARHEADDACIVETWL